MLFLEARDATANIDLHAEALTRCSTTSLWELEILNLESSRSAFLHVQGLNCSLVY